MDDDPLRLRRRSMESLFDAGTILHLSALGVRPGWRCLDLSAGTGAVTRWLADHAGPAGEVVAADAEGILPRPGDGGGARCVAWREAFDAVGEGGCDLVRARSLLAHDPNRAELLKRMVACLRPGGWLLVEETDWISATPVASFAGSFENVYRAALRAWSSGGYDPECGRHLPEGLAAAGLAGVESEGRVRFVRGGTTDVEWLRVSFERLRRHFQEPASLSGRQLDRALALLDDPEFRFLSPTMVAAWGRRP